MNDMPDSGFGDGFQLPLPGLFADLDAGAGTVQLPDEFDAAALPARLRLVADWQRALARLQQRQMQQLFDDIARRHPQLSSLAQARLFAQACNTLGLPAAPHGAVEIGRQRR